MLGCIVDPGELEYHWIEETLILGISTPFYGIKNLAKLWGSECGVWGIESGEAD